MKPNYEESQFATFFQDDLTHRVLDGVVRLAPIGQVLEAQLGFDMGYWVPPTHPLWRMFGVPPLPGLSGAGWNLNVNTTSIASSKAINVFLQYKRSDYLVGSRSEYLAEFGGPYWRFRVDRTDNPGSLPQHDLLEGLESRTDGSALVRYVAPITHRYDVIENQCDSRELLENCVFVRPAHFSPAHTTCAYTTPSNAIVNPDPEFVRLEDWPRIATTISDLMASSSDIPTLIAQASEALTTLGPRQIENQRYPWRLPRNLPGEAGSLLQSYILIAEWMFRANVTWLVALQPTQDAVHNES